MKIFCDVKSYVTPRYFTVSTDWCFNQLLLQFRVSWKSSPNVSKTNAWSHWLTRDCLYGCWCVLLSYSLSMCVCLKKVLRLLQPTDRLLFLFINVCYMGLLLFFWCARNVIVFLCLVILTKLFVVFQVFCAFFVYIWNCCFLTCCCCSYCCCCWWWWLLLCCILRFFAVKSSSFFFFSCQRVEYGNSSVVGGWYRWRGYNVVGNFLTYSSWATIRTVRTYILDSLWEFMVFCCCCWFCEKINHLSITADQYWLECLAGPMLSSD